MELKNFKEALIAHLNDEMPSRYAIRKLGKVVGKNLFQ